MEAPLFAFSWTTTALALVLLGFVSWRCRSWIRHRRSRKGVDDTTRTALSLDGGHRVASTLQMVLSLLRVHERRVRTHEEEPKEAAAALRAAEERIATVAIIHRELHRIAANGTADMGRLLWMVADSLAGSAGTEKQVTAHVECGSVSLPAQDAIPTALIVGEWVTHRLARRGKPTEIRIDLQSEDGFVAVQYADDGPDWDSDGDDEMLHSAIIEALVRQASGTLIRAPGQGVRLRLTFPASSAAVPQP